MKLDRVIAVRNNKTIYRDGDKCIKVFNADFHKADILNEALNQARIEETGLHIPKILEVTMVMGQWAIVSEYIKGKTMAQLMEENPEKKDEYLASFVDIQLSVHAKKCPLLNKLKDKMIRKIAATDLDATTRYDLHTRLDSMPKHDKVCHGDFNPSNIIITEDGTPYILDWSHATQGNASADAARTYLLFWLNGDIDGAKKYLDLFCQKSNTLCSMCKHGCPSWPLLSRSAAMKKSANSCFPGCMW
jgi:tRNA A-37 threonylcarbamoyl transferase component Bud32